MNLHLAFFIPGLVAVLIVLCIAWLADRNGKKTQQMYDAAGPIKLPDDHFPPRGPNFGCTIPYFDSQEEANRAKFRIQVERGQVVTVNGIPLHPDQVKSFNLDSIEIYVDGHPVQGSRIMQGIIETEMPEPDLKEGVTVASGRVLDAWGELLDKSRFTGETDESFRCRLIMRIAELRDWENE